MPRQECIAIGRDRTKVKRTTTHSPTEGGELVREEWYYPALKVRIVTATKLVSHNDWTAQKELRRLQKQ